MLLKTKILEELLTNKELTASQIAKEKNLNQKTVSNYLNNLEEQLILKSRTQGKNKLYSFNIGNEPNIRNFLVALENIRTLNFYKNNLLIKEVVLKIDSLIKGIAIIFGSYAKNKQNKNSDLDILVIGKVNEDKIHTISKIYHLDISIKCYPKFSKDLLMEEVQKHHIIIKGAEDWIRLNGV